MRRRSEVKRVQMLSSEEGVPGEFTLSVLGGGGGKNRNGNQCVTGRSFSHFLRASLVQSSAGLTSFQDSKYLSGSLWSPGAADSCALPSLQTSHSLSHTHTVRNKKSGCSKKKPKKNRQLNKTSDEDKEFRLPFSSAGCFPHVPDAGALLFGIQVSDLHRKVHKRGT